MFPADYRSGPSEKRSKQPADLEGPSHFKKQKVISRGQVGNIEAPGSKGQVEVGQRKPTYPLKSQKMIKGPKAPVPYCEYHKRSGHSTKECKLFNAEMAKILKRGPVYDNAKRPDQQGKQR